MTCRVPDHERWISALHGWEQNWGRLRKVRFWADNFESGGLLRATKARRMLLHEPNGAMPDGPGDSIVPCLTDRDASPHLSIRLRPATLRSSRATLPPTAQTIDLSASKSPIHMPSEV